MIIKGLNARNTIFEAFIIKTTKLFTIIKDILNNMRLSVFLGLFDIFKAVGSFLCELGKQREILTKIYITSTSFVKIINISVINHF